MQKLILDTNVIVSALISNSIPTKILYELVLTKDAETCVSTEIFTEYIEVLSRDRFDKYPNFRSKADVVLNKLREICSFHRHHKNVELITADLSDNKFLEVAAASYADYLITGNSLHFTFSEFEYTRIVSRREYWENYKA